MKMKKMLKDMFPIFKNVDEKFAEIGYIKINEDKFGVEYKRKNANLTQILYIGNPKENKESYESLNSYEMKLCIKKIKQMKRNLFKNNREE